MESVRPARAFTALLAAAACLAVPSLADAKKPPKLKVSTAKRVTTRMAKELSKYMNDDPLLDDGSMMTVDSSSAGPCYRVSWRRVHCRYDLYGSIDDLLGTVIPYDCYDEVRVKYAGRRGRHIRSAYDGNPVCLNDIDVGSARASKRPSFAGVKQAIRRAER